MESPFRAAGVTPDVIETLRWEDGAAPRLAAHLDRAERTAQLLGYPFDRARAEGALADLGRGPLRVRMAFSAMGAIAVTAAPLPPPAAEWRVTLSPFRLLSSDPWLRIKTTRRALYDRVRARLPEGVDEVLFLNERGAVCEGTITTVFLERDGLLLTPPVEAGLLPGVLRAELIAEGRARVEALEPEDLRAGRLFVGNALRGLIPARLAPPGA